MDFKTFLEHFDTIADAPNGIPKLRSLILDLAVQGKLVQQNPDDEPAKALIQRINKHQGKLYIQHDDESSKEVQLPKGWELVRLGDVLISDIGGGTPSKQNPQYWNGEIPWASVKDTGKTKYLDRTIDSITELGLKESSSNLIPPGRLIVCVRMGLGKLSINSISIAINQDLRALEPHPEISLDYLYNFFLNCKIQGAGMTVKGIKRMELLNLALPLPPLAEQKQIVEKVDELMALCDRLQAAKQTRDTLRQKLRGSAIDSLMNAETDEALQKGWAIVRDNWVELSQSPEDVGDLRRSVLQLAVRGKLVNQDPEDESAKQLLLKAVQEKTLMAQAGLISKPKQLASISEDEYPLPLPSSWTWVRLESLCTYVVDCLHRTPKYQDEGYPAIRTSEMKPGRILFEQARKVGREEYEQQTQRLVPKAGDIFYSREGSFGIAGVVPEGVELCLSQRMMQFRVVSEVDPHYFSWAMNSSLMYNQAVRDAAGMTVPHVNMHSLKEFIFPLAPFAEQKHIVVKVDELMQMCDRLEESLRQSQQWAEALAASAINHLTI